MALFKQPFVLAICLTLVILAGWLPLASGKQYSPHYSFLANRNECDGQCTYCKHSGERHRWSYVQRKISRYVYSFPIDYTRMGPLSREENAEVQLLIDWSWQENTRFTCVIGIIGLRLLSYGFSNPFTFNSEDQEYDVLDFLDRFNMHTGALDMMVSGWAAILAGGWPYFREFLHVRRKVRAHLLESERPDENLQRLIERGNECDRLDNADDVAYADAVRKSLEDSEPLPLGVHLLALRRGVGCPIGLAVAFLNAALHLIGSGHYQGSLKAGNSHVLQYIVAAQEAVVNWTAAKSNWSPFFDLLSTRWPIFEMLSELACINTERPCVTRSAWQCFDMFQRTVVSCPHVQPRTKQTFTPCGEHDICTWPVEEFPNPQDWCLPFDHRPSLPLKPWLLSLGHDEEERICSQCGQDGVLRSIFSHIGFREAAGLPVSGGKAPFFVEFGARKPDMLNSAVLRRFCNWDGVLLDSQPGETPHGGCPGCPGIAELVRTEFVTAENVVALFKKYPVPEDFDLLTIDTDFNDYWIWKALLLDGTFRPRVVAVDFNPDIPLTEAKTVKYEAMAEWDGSVYTVASLLAYALLAQAHDYVFAYALEMGAHAFFIRRDLLAEADHNLPLRNVQKASHPPDEKKRRFVDVLYDFIPGVQNFTTGREPVAGTVAQSPALDVDAVVSAVAAVQKQEASLIRQEVSSLATEVHALRELVSMERSHGAVSQGVSDKNRASRSFNVAASQPATGTPATGARSFYDGVRADAQ